MIKATMAINCCRGDSCYGSHVWFKHEYAWQGFSNRKLGGNPSSD